MKAYKTAYCEVSPQVMLQIDSFVSSLRKYTLTSLCAMLWLGLAPSLENYSWAVYSRYSELGCLKFKGQLAKVNDMKKKCFNCPATRHAKANELQTHSENMCT
jgi:hypothetical protein